MATPSAREQEFLTLLNAARADPAAYGRSIGVGLDGYAPRPPLVFDARLQDAAAFKSREMFENQYFAHTSPLTGKNSIDLVRERGYTFTTVAESIGAYPTPASMLRAWVEDAGITSLGHRKHLLGAAGHYTETHTHVGVGAVGDIGAVSGQWSGYWTVITAVGDTLVPVTPDPPPGANAFGLPVVSGGDVAGYPAAVPVTTTAPGWTWAVETADPRGVPVTTRSATCWYGDSFTLALPASLRAGAVYCCDWDGQSRVQKLELVATDTGEVFGTVTLLAFRDGIAVPFAVPRAAVLRVTRLAGPNAVVSAVRASVAPA